VAGSSESDDPWFDSSSGGFFSEDEFKFKESDPSIDYYPSPYCGIVEGKKLIIIKKALKLVFNHCLMNT
jgi:hypothetical protein